MQMFLWDSYEEVEINDKTKYWVDLWEDFIENFDNDSYGLSLINPHLLLKDLIDEIRFNRLKNPKIKTYFTEKLGLMLDSDPIIQNFFKNDFILISKELKNNRPKYFIELCESILKVFQNGVYFRNCSDKLKEILINSTWDDNDEEIISLISQNLIVEFILHGYSLNSIKDIPSNLFDKYTIIGDKNEEIITSKFPVSIKFEDFGNREDFNKKEYNNALKEEINNLTFSDRINGLKKYYDSALLENYFIFQVEGLIGNVDINIGNVNFYIPKIGNLDNNIKDFEIKKLGFFANESSNFINAAVKVKYRDVNSGKQSAIETIEKTLDYLKCFTHSKIPFEIKKNSYNIVDIEGDIVGRGFTSDDKFLKKHMSLDLKKFETIRDKEFIKLEEILYENLIKKIPLTNKIIFSLHWYRKAFESDNLEDKLLNYWIVIENLLTFDPQNENLVLPSEKEISKFVYIKNFVPPIELIDFIPRISKDLHNYLFPLIYSSQGSSEEDRPLLTLPEQKLQACQLERDIKEINLKEFINNLPSLIDIVPRKIIKDKLIYANKFYTDSDFAKQEIQKRLRQTEQDLLLIYRYRNLIVHNAHFDSTILPYYILKAQRFSGNLLRLILFDFINDKSKSHEEILLSQKIKIDRLIEKLNKESVDLWELR